MRALLLPFSWLYGLVVVLRNWLFDREWLPSASFPVPVVVVGNLSVGGTGKSPLVLQLAEQLRSQYKIGILSRGYGRSTRGFLLLDTQSTARQAGDEPLQYYRLLPGVQVAVCERRADGIRQLLEKAPDLQLILLDDAFQHRWVRPGFSILLSDYSLPFFQDRLLPVGRLREPAAGARRADLIVITKCPEDMSPALRAAWSGRLRQQERQEVLFSYIHYRELVHRLTGEKFPLAVLKGEQVLLVCGIARPEPLQAFLEDAGAGTTALLYGDHHDYTAGDAVTITQRFRTSGAVRVITTRKDAMRMEAAELRPMLDALPVFILDIQPGYFGGQDTPAAVLERFLARQSH